MGGYSVEDGRTLVAVLVVCAVAETDLPALEAQSHCLFELGARGLAGPESLGRLQGIRLEDLPPDLREYLDDLLEEPPRG